MPMRIARLFDHLTIDTRRRSKVTLNIPLSITNQSGATRWYKLFVQIDNYVYESVEKYAVDYGFTNLVLFSVDITPPSVSTILSKQIVLTVKEYADSALTIPTDYLSVSVPAYFIGPDVDVIWVDDFETGTTSGWVCYNANATTLVSDRRFTGIYSLGARSDGPRIIRCTKTYYTNVLGYQFYGIARVYLELQHDYIKIMDEVGGHYVMFMPTFRGYWIEMATKLEPDTANNLVRMSIEAKHNSAGTTRIDYVELIRAPL